MQVPNVPMKLANPSKQVPAVARQLLTSAIHLLSVPTRLVKSPTQQPVEAAAG